MFISSAAVFGESIIKKNTKPISPYGINKLKCENYIIKKGDKIDLDYKILRFFSLYGPGLKKQLIWDACKKLINKDLTFYGTGREIRTWMHIEDAVSIVSKTMIINNSKKIYNFCGTQKKQNKEIIKIIATILKLDVKIKFNGISDLGNPKVMYLKNCDLDIINYKQKSQINYGLNQYIKYFKKI